MTYSTLLSDGKRTNYTSCPIVYTLQQLFHPMNYVLMDQTTDVVFLADSRSALHALHNKSEPHLSRKLKSIIENRIVVLQWIPAHCGINSKEMA